MPAGSFDVASDEFGCLFGFAGFHVQDQLAMLTHDRCPPGEREVEPPAHGTEHFEINVQLPVRRD